MAKNEWENSGINAAREHSLQCSCRVVAISDGHIGSWRVMEEGETAHDAELDYRASYNDAPPDGTLKIETTVFENGEESLDY